MLISEMQAEEKFVYKKLSNSWTRPPCLGRDSPVPSPFSNWKPPHQPPLAFSSVSAPKLLFHCALRFCQLSASQIHRWCVRATPLEFWILNRKHRALTLPLSPDTRVSSHCANRTRGSLLYSLPSAPAISSPWRDAGAIEGRFSKPAKYTTCKHLKLKYIYIYMGV